MPFPGPHPMTAAMTMQQRLAPAPAVRTSPAPLPPAMGNMAPLAGRPLRRDGTVRLRALVPHQEQFATAFGLGTGVYWSRFDEALRDNWQNALAMRRSAFVEFLLSHRAQPVVALPWRIETDDPKDPEQVAIAERYTKLIKAIPDFQAMRLYLEQESLWQGKYGSQLIWDRVLIDGRPQVTVVAHEPVDGDSIPFKFDGTPGILVRSSFLPAGPDERWVEDVRMPWMGQTDRARALFLYDQNWRDHFIIQKFKPLSADYMFGGDKAGAVHGSGYRGQLYWDYQAYEELRTWLYDALERIGVNGQVIGYFEEGNPASRESMIEALKALNRDNVTAVPVRGGQKQGEKFDHIDPSPVGYDILLQIIGMQRDDMKLAVLGEILSSESRATGLNSGVAELHGSTRDHFIRYDAQGQAETLTRDLIAPLTRRNDWVYGGQVWRGELPFRVRFSYVIDKANAQERSAIVKTAYDIGLPLDPEQVYQDLALSPPKDPAHALVKMEMGGGGPMPPNAAPGGMNGVGGNGMDDRGGLPKLQMIPGQDGKPRIKPLFGRAGVNGANGHV
jgi:hypothetical protein